MSRSNAIAATTRALWALLNSEIPKRDSGIPSLVVTTRPPDLARKGIDPGFCQLNIFLYQTQANAAWRNLDIPNQVRPGETGQPPLALTLHYMLTAYGDESNFDDESVSHRVLGGAMSVLYDHPLVGGKIVADALNASNVADSGIATQFDRLRITPIVLPMDEMSKLWTALQTNYRVSAGYEVSVVLIDSTVPPRSVLPVLKRGAADRGPEVVVSATPALDSLRYPHTQQAAQFGDDIAIAGTHLRPTDTTVRLSHPRLDAQITLTPLPGDRLGEIKIHLPTLAEDANAMSKWAPGLYTLTVVMQPAGERPRVSNEIPFALAPSITVTPPSAAPGTVSLTLTCTPRIATGQRVMLVFGDMQVAQDTIPDPPNPPKPPADPPPPADANKPSELHFTASSVIAKPDGTQRLYTVRLRVDGVDSIPVAFVPNTPPAFERAQQVAVPP